MRLLALPLLLASACAGLHDGVADRVAGPGPGDRPIPRTEYVVADARIGSDAVALALGPDTIGVLVDGRRVVTGRGEPRVATERPEDQQLAGAARIPERLGGGFLFWSELALYRADTFEGHLAPIASFPVDITSVSFPPKGIIVHARTGERWGIDPRGERIPILPLGALDVEALDDGRAVTWNDAGEVSTSTDGGEHWSDVSGQVGGPVDNILQRNGELWVMAGAAGGRVEHDGRLSWFLRAPTDDLAVRAVDTRFQSPDPPLRVAIYAGAPIDGDTAVVIVGGDVARVDVRTGKLLSLVPASLPPEAHCESVPGPDEVLFACRGNGAAGSFVVAHATTGAPTIERTFPPTTFASSDDGGLLAEGSCSGATGVSAACVRQPDGTWLDRDLGAFAAGGPDPATRVTRWIPRADGTAVAAIIGEQSGLFDTATGTFVKVADEASRILASPMGATDQGNGRHAATPVAMSWVDRSFAYGPDGSLRAWLRSGETMLVRPDGAVVPSPYAFQAIAYAGAHGLGYVADAKRLYQSSDHGASWIEVALPPSGLEAEEMGGCSLVGCDLGAFYRLGWHARPPQEAPDRRRSPMPPQVRTTTAPELTCKPSGAVVSRQLPRTESFPDDIGLGAQQVPVAQGRTSYIHEPIVRGLTSPMHEPLTDVPESLPSLRALLTGYGTESEDGQVRVTGPNPSLLALRRPVAYVAPFDPSGRIFRSSFGVAEIVAAARRMGIPTSEVLENDPTHLQNAVPLLGVDPAGTTDLLLHDPETGVLVVGRGERLRTLFRPLPQGAPIVSGVVLPNDELALLELGPTGTSHVFKIAASGSTTELFDLATVGLPIAVPLNPDALGIGPNGELVVVRLPSGRDPAPAYDPAFVHVAGAPPRALAPWSEVLLDGDPACKADPGGYRVVLQLAASWLHVAGVRDAGAMLARVRWTASHPCVEAFEVRSAAVSLRAGAESSEVGAWIVGRGNAHARVAIAEGVEWRQPVECALRR